MPSWDDVRFFLEVSRAGTLAGAARKLGVDYTTVGRRINSLERKLGAKLFHRTPDGFVPTEAGEGIREAGEQMEQAALALERRALGADRRLSGTVRVAAAETMAQVLVVPAMRSLHSVHPEIRLHLLIGAARLDIARREADLAVRYVRPEKGDLIVRRLAHVAYSFYASKAYLSAHPVPPSGSSLTGHDAVRLEEGIRNMQKPLPDARVVLRANNVPALFEAVAQGLGIGPLPCCLADRRTDLHRIWPHEPVEFDELFLVVHPDVQRTGRVRAIINALEKRCAEVAGDLLGEHYARARRPRGARAHRATA